MIIAIVGPTGVGKTKLSVKLAKKYNAIIINCDAMQVYKKMDIGTAKIKENEKEGIPHYLFDIKDVTDNYTVYDYQKDARNLIVDTKILRKKEKAYSLLINIIDEYNLRVLLTKIYWDKQEQREEYKEFSKKYREVEKLSIVNKEEYLKQKQILFLKADLKKVYQNENRYYKIIKFYKDKLVELGAMRKLKNGCMSYGYYVKADKKLKKVVNK